MKDQYRISKEELLDEMVGWNSFLKRKTHLIACGGTAMTLLNIKASTKDIDFMVPNVQEYKYLITTIESLGYTQVTGNGWRRDGKFVYDLFCGNNIHTTELLESPLESKNHIPYEEFTQIYIGILNFYDLITSKIFRGTHVDFEDCLTLIKARYKEIDIDVLNERFHETASYDVSEKEVTKKMKEFMELIKKEGIYD